MTTQAEVEGVLDRYGQLSLDVQNIQGVFADLDDGGLTEDEALAQIRKLVGARKPLPDKITLVGTLPFTITMDTRTKTVDEFEVSYEFPTFEQKAEKRVTGEELEIDEDQLKELTDFAEANTGEWPEPERA